MNRIITIVTKTHVKVFVAGVVVLAVLGMLVSTAPMQSLATGEQVFFDAPDCPYNAAPGRYIVNFTDVRLFSNTQGPSESPLVSANIPAGEYTISMASFDGYSTRDEALVGGQKMEWWIGKLYHGNSVVAETGHIQDLEDKVKQAQAQGVANSKLTLSQDVTGVKAVHPEYWVAQPNSVVPLCIVFDGGDVPEQPKTPECDAYIRPTSIEVGQSADLSWNSKNVHKVVFDNNLGEVGQNGMYKVSPTVDTTYTGTFTGKGGEIQCSASITVTEPKVPETPVCPLSTSEYDYVVDIQTEIIRSDKGENQSKSQRVGVSIPRGVYDITLASFDDHILKGGQNQPEEQWYLRLLGMQDLEIIDTDAIGDLPEHDNYIVEQVAHDLDVFANIQAVQAIHDAYPSSNANSIVPVCAGFKKKDVEVPAPQCTLAVNRSSVNPGESVEVSWTSENTVSATINNGIGGVDVTGATTTVVTSDTTFVGTFVGENGDTITCEAPVTVHVDEAPICEMAISSSRVNQGDSVTLSWSSQNTTSGEIDNGIGALVDAAIAAGSQSVTVNNDTTYTGVWSDDDGTTVTCTASVTINTGGGGGGDDDDDDGGGGGGGGCLNCGDDDDDDDGGGGGGDDDDDDVDEPIVVLSSELQSPSRVSLTQVPYTGFDASPFVTALFWFTLMAASVGLAYAAATKNFFSNFFGNNSQSDASNGSNVHGNNYGSHSDLAYIPYAKENEFNPRSEETSQGDDLETFIDEKSQAQQVLLSPEATATLIARIESGSENPTSFVDQFLSRAQEKYSREDGWILLSNERVAQVMDSVSTHSDVSTHVQNDSRQEEATTSQSSRIVEVPAKNTAQTMPRVAKRTMAPSDFISALVQGQQQQVFEHLRSVSGQGNASVEAFIGGVVRELDEVYKQRLEGGHKPNQELAGLTATWSNADFETLLGILVESVDFSYSSSRVGTKVALAKAFEYFSKK